MKHSYSWPDYLVTLRVNPITRTYTIVNKDEYCCVDKNGKIVLANKSSDHPESDRVIDGGVVTFESLTVNLSSDKPETESDDQLTSSDVELKNTRVIFTIGEEKFDKSEEIKPEIENSDNQLQSNSSEHDPPVITVIDFDGPASEAKSWNNGCSKCNSETYLNHQVDPFRASIESAVKKFDKEYGRYNYRNNRIVEKRFRSRSATYELPPNFGRIFGRRTKSLAEPKCGSKKNDGPSAGVNHKKEVLLRGHYYPEGGWGFIIVTCSALVHLLGVGLQLSVPGTVYISAELKFNHPPVDSSAHKYVRAGHVERPIDATDDDGGQGIKQRKVIHRGNIIPII